jgi:hypothetical protein
LRQGKPVWLAVHRHQNMVYYKRLDAVQFRLLNALQKGKSFRQALATVPPSVVAAELQGWFRDWAALGWFHSGKKPGAKLG